MILKAMARVHYVLVFTWSLLVLLTYHCQCTEAVAGDDSGRGLFIESPQTQCIGIGESATFNCKTVAHLVFWILNGRLLEEHDWDDYPNITFTQEFNSHSHNLSMTIYGRVQMNNTQVSCVASEKIGSAEVESNLAILQIYFPPTPPNISLDFQLQDSTALGAVHLSPTYIWHDYKMSYYNFTVVNETDHFAHVVYTGLVPINNSTNTLVSSITESQISLLSSSCSLITLIVTSVSPSLGSSQPANISVVSPNSVHPIFDDLNSSVPAIRSTVYFNINGTPLVTLQAKVLDVCSYLDIQYTICIEEPVQTSKNQSLMKIGPKALPTSGLITEELIKGLSKDTEYSFWIQLESLQSTREHILTISERYSFHTILRTETSLPSCTTTVTISSGNSYQLAAILLSVLSVVLLVAMVIACICCICTLKHKSMRGKQTKPSSAMITNPIYDGPVYESVRQQYNPLNSSTSTTPDSSPTAPLNDPARYSNDPTIHQVDQVRRNTLPISPRQPVPRVISPLAATSLRSASISGNTTYKHPRRERNKLHLTLSLGNNEPSSNPVLGGGKTGTLDKKSPIVPQSIPLEVDENYTVMSPARNRGFGSSLNGGWGEISPELTNKYHE